MYYGEEVDKQGNRSVFVDGDGDGAANETQINAALPRDD